MRAVLRTQSPDSGAVCAALDRWLAGCHGLHWIGVFAALPGEVDLSEFIARHPERCWVYPRVAGATLTLHAVGDPALELVAATFGIREPAPALPPVAVTRIDAFLCPGLAFDVKGGRLGRGRGYYDRMLAGARPEAMKIGVCAAYQIVPDTFPQPHDVRMDRVVCA